MTNKQPETEVSPTTKKLLCFKGTSRITNHEPTLQCIVSNEDERLRRIRKLISKLRKNALSKKVLFMKPARMYVLDTLEVIAKSTIDDVEET